MSEAIHLIASLVDLRHRCPALHPASELCSGGQTFLVPGWKPLRIFCSNCVPLTTTNCLNCFAMFDQMNRVNQSTRRSRSFLIASSCLVELSILLFLRLSYRPLTGPLTSPLMSFARLAVSDINSLLRLRLWPQPQWSWKQMKTAQIRETGQTGQTGQDSSRSIRWDVANKKSWYQSRRSPDWRLKRHLLTHSETWWWHVIVTWVKHGAWYSLRIHPCIP